MGFGNNHRGHKETWKCPKCNYTSRVFVSLSMNNKTSNHSRTCPKHRLKLIPTWFGSGLNKLKNNTLNNE